jgi:hypothetical protein
MTRSQTQEYGSGEPSKEYEELDSSEKESSSTGS